MDSNIDPIVLNGLDYDIWAPDIEILLKSKGLWKYTKTVILDPMDDQVKFVIDDKKHEAVGVIMTCISWEIRFHTSGINCPHQVWKNMKYLFDKVDKIQVIQLEKEFISLNPHSFDIIEDYFALVKKMQLKLCEFGKNFYKKDGKIIDMVLINLRAHFNVFCSTFRTNWKACKEEGKDYTFDILCGLLINDQLRFFDERKLGGQYQAQLLKGKGKMNYK
jgi:hypothetical protein